VGPCSSDLGFDSTTLELAAPAQDQAPSSPKSQCTGVKLRRRDRYELALMSYYLSLAQSYTASIPSLLYLSFRNESLNIEVERYVMRLLSFVLVDLRRV
jgi:hypothetical protein